MGFFDILKGVANSALDSAQKNAAEIQELKDKMDYYSDEQLFQAIRRGSYQNKAACSLLLQERGYSQEEVAAAMKGQR